MDDIEFVIKFTAFFKYNKDEKEEISLYFDKQRPENIEHTMINLATNIMYRAT